MNMAMVRRNRWIALLLAIVLAAAAGYALAPRSHASRVPSVSIRQLAARLQAGTNKPGDPIYMKITGIPGESTAAGHRNWIDLNSWDFTMSQGDGSPNFSVLTVKTPASRVTPALMAAIAHGTLLPTVTLQASQTSPVGRTLNFLTITLSQVNVTGVQDASTGGRPTDTITFRFNQIDYKYTLQGKNYDFCWQISTITAC